MKKTVAIANTAALIVTIAINYLSNAGMINGNTMQTISDRYSNYFTPAGYAFSIWGLIYLGMLGFVIHCWRSLSQKNNQVLTKVGWWFVVSCIANSLWVIVWLNDQPGIAVLLMILLLVSLIKIVINTSTAERQRLDWSNLLFIRWPFSIYFGWVSVALVANVAAFLTEIRWNGWGVSEPGWTIIMICIAGLVNVAVIQSKKLYPFGLVGIWALLAIAVANKNNSGIDSIIYACYGVAALLAILIVVNLFTKKLA